MTETLFEYDHLLMRSEYRTPDIHSHLAIHLIVGLGTGLHCTVADEKFDTESVFIASDVPHTAYSYSGEMLVFLFDPACRYANEIDKFPRTAPVDMFLTDRQNRGYVPGAIFANRQVSVDLFPQTDAGHEYLFHFLVPHRDCRFAVKEMRTIVGKWLDIRTFAGFELQRRHR